jgi:O-succinylbenzoic acid--CoA ligase
VLAGHPHVADVTVVGRPDPEWGEAVVAVVVPTGPVDLADLRELAAVALGKAWAPRDLVTVDAFPSLPSGKVDREALRNLVRELGPAGQGA